jgi:23S rRNA (guanosine2251-2'-O)-methyltransferase
VQSVNRKTLDDKAEGNNHQGIMAKVIEAPKLAEHDLASLLDWRRKRQRPSCWCWTG